MTQRTSRVARTCPLSGGKAIASGENADRKREIAFTRDPFMFFGDTLDAVARVARISVRHEQDGEFHMDPGLMNEEPSVQARLSDRY
jgi:hypothetical protein